MSPAGIVYYKPESYEIQNRYSIPHYHALLAILAVFLCWPVMVLGMDASDYYREAQEFFEKGQPKHAVIQLKNALLLNPENLDARLLLGKIYLGQEEVYSAEKELSRARDLGATRDDVLIPLGRALLMLGQDDRVIEEITVEKGDSIPLQISILLLQGKAYLKSQALDKADEKFSEVLALEPATADALLGQARISIVRKDPGRTTELIERALAADPKHADALALKGGLLRTEGKLQDAVSVYDQALLVEPGRTGTRLGKAMALIGLGQYAEAEAEIDLVKEKDRDYYMVHYTRALLLSEQQELEPAQDSLQRALNRAPDYMPAHLLAGIVFYQQGQFNQAEQHLEKYRQKAPGNQQADMLHAAIFMKLNEPGKTIAILEPGVLRAGDNAQYLALLGSAYMADGRAGKGLEYLERAADMAPDVKAIRAQLAIGILAQGATEEGIAELQQVVDLGPGLLQAEVMLVIGYLQREDFNQAIMAADALVTKLPDNPVPYNLKGLALLNAGEPEAAREAFETAIRLRPGFTHAYLNLAQLDLAADDIAAAKLQYLQVLKQDEGNLQALFPLAALAEREGRPMVAEQWLKQARKYHPEPLEPAVLLAELYERQGETRRALDLAEAAAVTHPRNTRVLLTLARVQMTAGKEQEALVTLHRLVEVAPESPKAYTLLAMVQIKQQQNEAARSSLEQVIKLQPDSPVARVMLGQLDIAARDFNAALAMAEGLRKSHPDAIYGEELAGDIYTARSKYKQAADAYALAYNKERSAKLAQKLFQAHRKNGEHEAARQALELWLAEAPGDIAMRSLLAAALQSEGHNGQAIGEYLRVLERDPDNISALNNIAWIYQEEGISDGVRYAERAYELAPGRPEVTDTLGWLLVQNGDTNRGLVLLQEAAVKAPHVPEIRYHMAVALAKAGRRDESRKVLDRLLKAGKGFQGMDEARTLREQLGG